MELTIDIYSGWVVIATALVAVSFATAVVYFARKK